MNPSMILFVSATCLVFAVTGFPGHEHHEPANYKFGYSVHDPHTGDIKEQHEERDGHVVKGSYTLHEADGTKRVVEYVAGPHTGFNAVVKRIGHAQHPQHYHHQAAPSGHVKADSSVGTTHWGFY